MPEFGSHRDGEREVFDRTPIVALLQSAQAATEPRIVVHRIAVEDGRERDPGRAVAAGVELRPGQCLSSAPGGRLGGDGVFEQRGGRRRIAVVEQVEGPHVPVVDLAVRAHAHGESLPADTRSTACNALGSTVVPRSVSYHPLMPDATTTPPVPDGLMLRPFRALRFDATAATGPAQLGARLSPPYDVIDDAELAALESRDPHNAVRLILPRGGGERYAAAAGLLARWRSEGVLVADDEAALYVYECATADGHVQRGLVGSVGLARADAGIVLPHENTMAGPVADRLALTAATAANLEPIFLVYDGGGPASAAVAEAGSREPLATAVTADRVTHRLWAITDAERLDAIATDLAPRRAVIADGHHRYATYLAYQELRHAAGDGPGAWDYGLSFLVDASAFGPQVHAIHRVVPGLAPAEAAERAGSAFTVRALGGSLDEALLALEQAGKSGPAFLISAGAASGPRWLLTDPAPAALDTAIPAERSAAWRGLDVTVAHLLLIRRLWGCEDTEQVVGYQHDVESALRAAGAGVALLLNPTPVEDVVAVAAAGERMPRKSTLFTPKPATGLLIRALELG